MLYGKRNKIIKKELERCPCAHIFAIFNNEEPPLEYEREKIPGGALSHTHSPPALNMKDETKECAAASTSYELLLHSSLFSSSPQRRLPAWFIIKDLITAGVAPSSTYLQRAQK